CQPCVYSRTPVPPRPPFTYIPPVNLSFLHAFSPFRGRRVSAPGVLPPPVAAATAWVLGGARLAGCQKSGTQPVVLAGVDGSKLTLDALRETSPAEYEQVIPRAQYLDLIQRWIDDEAVYQQALKRKLDQDPQVKRKLARLQRRMIIEEFLARETGGSGETEPDEGAMTRYYE